jgi:hypothetical protein
MLAPKQPTLPIVEEAGNEKIRSSDNRGNEGDQIRPCYLPTPTS